MLTILSRLLWAVKGERKAIIAVLIFAFTTSALSLVVPIAVQALVNTVALSALSQQLIILVAIVFLVLCFSGVLSLLQNMTVEVLQRRLFFKVSLELTHRIAHYNLKNHFRIGPEKLNTFLEIQTIQKSLSFLFIEGISVILQLVVGLTLLGLYHPLLLGLSIFLFTAICFIFIFVGRGGLTTAEKECSAKYAVLEILEDFAKQPILFHGRRASSFAFKEMESRLANWLKKRKKHFKILLTYQFFTHFLHATTSSLLLGGGGYLVINGELTLGQLVAAELIVNSSLSSLIKFNKYLESIYDLGAGVDKLGDLTQLEVTDVLRDQLQANKAFSVELKGVVVGATENSSIKILDNINFKINPCDRVFIAGANGSGKTVLLESIFGIVSLQSGVILVDNCDIRDINPESLADRIMLLSDIDFFHGTIIDNLSLGSAEADRQSIRHALDSVGLINKIDSLEQGLDTYINPTDVFFSKGERAKFAIARAMIFKPGLLLVNEMLDDVDPDSLEKITSILFSQQQNWTVVVSTKDPGVYQRFKTGYFMKSGKLENSFRLEN